MIIKRFFPLIALAIALPCFGMNENAQPQSPQEQQSKQKITQENFDKAMNAINSRPIGGDYLAKQLSIKLQHCINQELTANEWADKVQKAYSEIIIEVTEFGFSLMTNNPLENVFEEIFKATFPELFSANPPPPQA